MPVFLHGLSTALPPHVLTQDEVREHYLWREISAV